MLQLRAGQAVVICQTHYRQKMYPASHKTCLKACIKLHFIIFSIGLLVGKVDSVHN
jgi:hypothetical protein